MLAPITDTLLITQLFGSLRGGPDEAYIVDHGGVRYRTIGHVGIDINCPLGTPVNAMKGGVVRYFGAPGDPDDGYAPLGLHAVVTLPSGEEHWYAHLSGFSAPDGMPVAAGRQIGLSGSSGASSGPHLHIAWRPANKNFRNGFDGFEDPMPHFNADVYPRVDLRLV